MLPSTTRTDSPVKGSFKVLPVSSRAVSGQPAQLPQNPNAGETLPFTDVNANSWYYSGVKYAYEN